MPFCLGDIVRDRYKIIQELGRGGWGIAYLAQDTQLPNNSCCVIKEITPSPSLSSQQNRNRFEDEARALYTLGNHPQIPQLFARFVEEERFYLVQEYIKGQNLKDKFAAGYRLSAFELIDFLLDILEVLQFVHQHNRIHLDLKPANLIQREQDGKLVVIDFGSTKEIATLEYTPKEGIRTTIAVGTPGYMPAEQLSCNPQYNSDIYALGIVAIQAITGLFPPISSENNSEVNNSMQIDSRSGEIIWQNKTNFVSSLNINSRIKDVLNKMIRYSFRDRYQNATEVIQDLQQLKSEIKPTTNYPNIRLDNGLKLITIGLAGLVMGGLIVKVLPSLNRNASNDTEITSSLPLEEYQDYPINFEDVCNSPLMKGENLKDFRGKPQLTPLESLPIWSVFHWKCAYYDENQVLQTIKGINLNDYCKATSNKPQYEAYFRDYRDPNSWYCTNVGTKLNN